MRAWGTRERCLLAERKRKPHIYYHAVLGWQRIAARADVNLNKRARLWLEGRA